MNLLRLARPRSPRDLVPTPPGGTAIALDRVSVELGGHRVLHDVSLDIRAGELLALVGPNGAGKSTLLAAVCGDLEPAAGTIRLAGADLGDWSPLERARRRAMLPQRTTLTFPFTVEDVVRMGRAPWVGTPEEDADDAAVAEAMAHAEVADLAGRTFTSLSGGEQARAALARVLAQRTAVLLLDEPTAALDLHHQELVLRLARRRAEAGDAVVVVLHDLGLAAAHAQRVALLAGGTLRAAGPPTEVFTDATLSLLYQHDIEVFPHPRTGHPLVVPRRDPTPTVRSAP